MGNFNLNLVCFVVRPVASDVPVSGEIALFKCLPTLCYFALGLLFIAKLSLRQLLLSIATGAVDLDDRMVFLLIPSYILSAFGKINLT